MSNHSAYHNQDIEIDATISLIQMPQFYLYLCTCVTVCVFSSSFTTFVGSYVLHQSRCRNRSIIVKILHVAFIKTHSASSLAHTET